VSLGARFSKLEELVGWGRAGLGSTILVVLLSVAGAQAAELPGRVSYFEENRGQAPSEVLFVARGVGFRAFLTQHGAVLVRSSETALPGPRAVSRVTFTAARKQALAEGLEPLPARVHYLLGSDSAEWIRGVKTYRSVRYRGLYPGVELIFEAGRDDGWLRLEAEPGADVDAVRSLLDAAELGIHTQGSAAASVPAPGATGDPPSLVYSTYAGGSSDDNALDIAIDREGAAYVSGWTTSVDFPVQGGLQPPGGGIDVFVNKYDAQGVLVFATYLGGSAGENGYAIAVDRGGRALVAGNTGSADFPVFRALQPALSGSQDAFVAKLTRDGSSLRYSTYLGGPDNPDFGTQGDVAFDIALGAGARPYVVGMTPSLEFPTTPGAFQPQHAGSFDGFVARLSADGALLEYSSYLGGGGSDRVEGVQVDRQGHAFVAGSTTSADFPTASPIFALYAGLNDAFVTQLTPDGSGLVYSTYLGGNGDDVARGLSLQRSGRVTVTGWSNSSDYPLEMPLSAGGTGDDVFVTRLETAGTALVYSTLIGGSELDMAEAVAVDRKGSAYVTGRTWSLDFPVERPLRGKMSFEDAFVLKLSPSGRRLVYSTFLGGADVVTSVQAGFGIAARAGSAYVAGATDARDFPLADAQQPVYGGGASDAFVAKIADPPPGQ
jgi:hypothetical protein